MLRLCSKVREAVKIEYTAAAAEYTTQANTRRSTLSTASNPRYVPSPLAMVNFPRSHRPLSSSLTFLISLLDPRPSPPRRHWRRSLRSCIQRRRRYQRDMIRVCLDSPPQLVAVIHLRTTVSKVLGPISTRTIACGSSCGAPRSRTAWTRNCTISSRLRLQK